MKGGDGGGPRFDGEHFGPEGEEVVNGLERGGGVGAACAVEEFERGWAVVADEGFACHEGREELIGVHGVIMPWKDVEAKEDVARSRILRADAVGRVRFCDTTRVVQSRAVKGQRMVRVACTALATKGSA